MKAIVKYDGNPGSLAVKDVPVPEPGPGEVLLKIKATGICHTDITILMNEYKGRKPVPIPVILGHEGAGVVAETGPGANCFKKGDRVAFEPLSGCGHCFNCKNGDKNMCTDWEHVGITCDGTFAEYLVVPETSVHLLPDTVSFADAAFLEPIGLTVRSIEHVKPMVGDVAAVVGPGSIGLFHVQALKAAGTKVIVVGLAQDKYRFEIAKTLGADYIINGSEANIQDEVKKITKGRGADIVIETASSPKALVTAYDIVGTRGRISTFGLYPEATIKPIDILRKGVTIYGDVALLTRHFVRAIRWVEDRKVLAEPLITKRFSLDQAREAIDELDKGHTVKVLFEL